MGRFHELFTQLYGYEPSIEIPAQEKTKSLFHTTLITYPDSYGKISDINLTLPIDSIHILPFFESTSDGGFSVKDYTKIPKEYGSWKDISRVDVQKNVMADLILNHVSAKHEWFESFLQDGEYRDFFHSFDKKPDEEGIYRPRTKPLFSKFKTKGGIKFVWTTFSADQIDLNYNNPQVLFAMLDVMKELILKGIKIIRLDAVGYAWKEIGTSCFHHPKTFLLVELFREYAKSIDPSVRLLAEVVDRQEVSDKYLDSVDFVYDFRPGSGTLFALNQADTEVLYRIDISNKRFGVLSTHDGTSLNSSALDFTEQKRIAKGRKGYRTEMKTKIPYELQSSFRWLAGKGFYVAHAYLLFSFQRCGVYYRCLHDVSNNYALALKNGDGRSLNRGKVVGKEFDSQMLQLLKLRHSHKLLEFGHSLPIKSRKELFVCLRYNSESACLVVLNFSKKNIPFTDFDGYFDVVSETNFSGHLEPYGYVVLKK